MSLAEVKKLYEVNETHFDGISELSAKLGPRFAERAARADEGDLFVAENFVELKAHGLVAAGVPKELGGGGASHAELADMLRQLGYYCGSTALAFSMHTHQVATAAWRWRHQKAPVDGLLKRVAAENIVILSSGGSDWLQGSGTATRAERFLPAALLPATYS
jgi:alkylation response protein AidB-like acyl-CoA dehydrogenase